MPRAIVLRNHGDATSLVLEDVPLPTISAGELLVRHTAVSVNFHDVYVRNGLYKTLALPGIPGLEATGIVEAVGVEVTDFAVGDRIAYVDEGYGAYCEVRRLDARKAIAVPDGLNDAKMAASFMKGMTTHVLLDLVARLQPGQTVVVHAAAGGMGQLLCQWASQIGARVIGTVGTAKKAQMALACGASDALIYSSEDVVSRVLDLTRGLGADIVFDSVGAATIDASFDCLAPLGHLVSFGQSSGPAEPIPLARLADKSLTISRPILFHYIREREKLLPIAQAALDALAGGTIVPIEPICLPLSDAAQAHRLIEARQSPGGIVLLP
jgi:NADPH2:quinone reductase